MADNELGQRVIRPCPGAGEQFTGALLTVHIPLGSCVCVPPKHALLLSETAHFI